jgi:ATP-dependent DNA helicase RecQ
MPQSKSAMLQIHGVGEKKFQKYGSAFLDVILDYAKEKSEVN